MSRKYNGSIIPDVLIEMVPLSYFSGIDKELLYCLHNNNYAHSSLFLHYETMKANVIMENTQTQRKKIQIKHLWHIGGKNSHRNR